jgi:NADPH-dependent glutamate synthase beta subunit-like oxidoreductase
MKRFLVEWHEASGIPDVMPHIETRDERVAVVGAGPAGLSVARELAMKGFVVTVFDSLPYGGGTMLIGVPAFRLPREAIEMDVRLVERLGVTFVYNTTIGRDITFEQLQRDFDAVAITAGAMDAVALDIPGADFAGVDYGVDFMKRANLGEEIAPGRDVVVIGGGYTAMDCSRTSLRHGAERVSIVYRRTRSELARSRSSARTATSPASGSSATASASRTRPVAARRSRSRAPSSSSRPTRSSRPFPRPRT